jgi:hypothetical protein
MKSLMKAGSARALPSLPDICRCASSSRNRSSCCIRPAAGPWLPLLHSQLLHLLRCCLEFMPALPPAGAPVAVLLMLQILERRPAPQLVPLIVEPVKLHEAAEGAQLGEGTTSIICRLPAAAAAAALAVLALAPLLAAACHELPAVARLANQAAASRHQAAHSTELLAHVALLPVWTLPKRQPADSVDDLTGKGCTICCSS